MTLRIATQQDGVPSHNPHDPAVSPPSTSSIPTIAGSAAKTQPQESQETQEKQKNKKKRTQETPPKRDLCFMDLPTELHLQIAQYLIYPDALSLKHSSRYFYHFVDTGIELKVTWLMDRRRLHLDCPNDTRCDLGSDLRFCRGSVPLLMKRRREHIECESRPGLGCLIYGTATCAHRRGRFGNMAFWRRRLTIEMWWVLLALVPVVLSWVWFAELLGLV